MSLANVMECGSYEINLIKQVDSPINRKLIVSGAHVNTISRTATDCTGFSIEEIIGSGGFGSVFLGRFGGTKVAVKTLHKSTKNVMASKQSFCAEMNVIGLNHENLVNVMATTTLEDFDSGALIVMEYVGKRNLLQTINDSTINMPIMQCIRYGIDIGRALDYLHAQGIIHLDIKPANIFITDNERCKIGDFGCTQRIAQASIETPRRRNRRGLAGTVAYRAPELLRGKTATTKADVYSMGVTLWQMFVRETPYEGQDHHVVVFSVVAKKQRPRFPEEMSITSEWYKNLCVACWGCSPEDRPDADHVMNILQQRLKGYSDADNA
ncbi:serine/threonine-protein kinase mos-like [Amphiura filiformis]|uniref:serine/threonine-protein kinase mos-like n=1 Tax=Amphiura filiformis TaxID=82378 RepID=UPI003B2270E6